MEITFLAGSTPITVFIPSSARGFNKTPSLHPNSTTVASDIFKNRLEISEAYSEMYARF